MSQYDVIVSQPAQSGGSGKRDTPKWSAAIMFLIKPVLLLEYVKKKKSIKLFHLKFKCGIIKTTVYVYNVCEYTD